jgi:hypothetical protein
MQSLEIIQDLANLKPLVTPGRVRGFEIIHKMENMNNGAIGGCEKFLLGCSCSLCIAREAEARSLFNEGSEVLNTLWSEISDEFNEREKGKEKKVAEVTIFPPDWPNPASRREDPDLLDEDEFQARYLAGTPARGSNGDSPDEWEGEGGAFCKGESEPDTFEGE